VDLWQYPSTWKVGDKLDADTLNDRVRDKNNLLLRKPLTFATMSASQAWGSGNLTLGWDTIVQDDDGMVLGDASPTTQFYAQRTGTYRFWCAIAVTSLATAQGVALTTLVNGVTVFQNAYRMEARSGLPFMLNNTGLLTMSAGESLKMFAFNALGTSTLTITPANNSPYVAFMWMGAT
jgi:hypothetical protein